MNTYDEIYNTLLELCKNENLRLIEADLSNDKICFAGMEDRIILNKNYWKFKELIN